MTEARLIELIEAYGADPAAWPADQAADAAKLLVRPSARVQAALSEAAALDADLAALASPEPSAQLYTAILDSAPKPASTKSRNWFGGWARPALPAGAAFASLVVGFLMGTTLLAEPTVSEPGESAVYAALGLESYRFDFIEESE